MAFREMTIASSPSKSMRWTLGGSTMGSSGARRDDGGLRKSAVLGGKIIEFSRMVEVIPAEADNLLGTTGVKSFTSFSGQERSVTVHFRYFSGDFANHVTGDHALQN